MVYNEVKGTAGKSNTQHLYLQYYAADKWLVRSLPPDGPPHCVVEILLFLAFKNPVVSE